MNCVFDVNGKVCDGTSTEQSGVTSNTMSYTQLQSKVCTVVDWKVAN